MSMENRRPQLNLPELHQLKWLLGGLLAFIAVWTVVYMDVQAWLLLALLTLAIPVMTAKPGLAMRVPRWVHLLAFPVLLSVFAVDLLSHLKEPLPPVIRLALMLVLYRVITPRKRRDDLQIIVLGLFLVVVGGVLSVSIVFAVQIVVFTACALLFLLVITLVNGMEEGLPLAAGATPGWMHVEWRRLAHRLRECVDWRVAVLGGLLFAGVVGLSAVLFMAIPRFELGNSLFLDRLITGHTKTGFSENIQFGDVVDIQQDTGVALSVDVSDRSQVPSELYWRMLVLDEYAKGSFRMSAAVKYSIDRVSAQNSRVQGEAPPLANESVWIFYLETGTSRFLPLLGGFNEIAFEGEKEVAFSRDTGLVMLRQTPSKMLAYRLEGMQTGSSLRLPEKIAQIKVASDKQELKAPSLTALDLHADEMAKLAAWVAEIGAPRGSPVEFARGASRWLAKRHGYSLQSEIAPGRAEADPLVRWMDSGSPGHCELFAGAFALLARTAGYPTRLALGFKGGSWNARSESITIRNSDAHAWCEIFDAAAGAWLRVDPTPGSVVVGDPANASKGEAVLARIRDDSWAARFESLRVFWYRRIVNFDQQSQVRLVRNAKKLADERLRALKKTLRAELEALKGWIASPWDVRRASAWGLAAAGIACGVVGWRLAGRGAWLRWRGGRTRGGVDPVRREAGRWLRKISDSEAGISDLACVRTELEKLRYGRSANWPEPMGIFRRAKRALAGRRR